MDTARSPSPLIVSQCQKLTRRHQCLGASWSNLKSLQTHTARSSRHAGKATTVLLKALAAGRVASRLAARGRLQKRRAAPASDFTQVQRVAILGGTHGNELNSIELARRFLANPAEAQRGSFETDVHIANPAAVTERLRYVDKDLNRCFNASDLNATSAACDEVEVLRARELNAILGPKGSAEPNVDFVIDLHNTTSNMGLSLMMAPDDALAHEVAYHVLTQVDEAVQIVEWEQAEDWPMLPTCGKSGLTVEVGPVAQGCLHAELFERTCRVVLSMLDFLDRRNLFLAQGIGSTLQVKMPVFERVGVVRYIADTSASAMVHPHFQDGDFKILREGDPLFSLTDGSTREFRRDDHSLAWCNSLLYAVFVNEAAYYEKGIAMAIAQKVERCVVIPDGITGCLAAQPQSTSKCPTMRLLSDDLSSLRGRSLLSIDDLSEDEIYSLLNLSVKMKATNGESDDQHPLPLAGESLAMIFQKRSTRTRVSAETGMARLGGHAIFLGPSDTHLGESETVKDSALVLSRFNSLILARVSSHADVEELSREARIPVINALSDLHHPLQTLADLMTLQQHFGNLTGLTISWVGDGNNVLHDLMLGCAKLGMNIHVATPKGYEPNSRILDKTRELAAISGARICICNDPSDAVRDADAVFTDTWVSMGEEAKRTQKIRDFAGYQVTDELMAVAKTGAVFMHCLPRKPEEVTDSVLYSPSSLVFQEAENRMWTVMAVMLSLLRG